MLRCEIFRRWRPNHPQGKNPEAKPFGKKASRKNPTKILPALSAATTVTQEVVSLLMNFQKSSVSKVADTKTARQPFTAVLQQSYKKFDSAQSHN